MSAAASVRVLEARSVTAATDPTLRATLVIEIATAEFKLRLHGATLHVRDEGAWVRTPDHPSPCEPPPFHVAGGVPTKPISFPTPGDAEAFQHAVISAVREFAPDLLAPSAA